MPYLTVEDRKKLPVRPGSLNYLITRVLIQSFVEHPVYDTLHVLRRDFVTDKKHNVMLNQMRNDYAEWFTVADIYAASEMAFNEFYRRVGVAYEESKMVTNGDLPEYQAVLKLISELNKPSEAQVTEIKA